MTNTKLSNSWTEWYGIKSDGTTTVSDYDIIKQKTGIDPFELKSVKVKKIKTGRSNISDLWGTQVQFTYQVTSQDGRAWEVEGYATGGMMDPIIITNIPEDDYLLSIKGGIEWNISWIQFKTLKSGWLSASPSYWKAPNQWFETPKPPSVMFFRRAQHGSLCFGWYYSSENISAPDELGKTQSEIEAQHLACGKIFTEWENTFGTDFGKPITVERLKTAKDKLNELQTGKTKAEGERDTAQNSLKAWTDAFGTLKPSEITKEKHTDAELKPADLPTDWKEQIAKKTEWETTFAGKSAEDVKNELDSLNYDLEDLRERLSAYEEGKTRALFEVTPK